MASITSSARYAGAAIRRIASWFRKLGWKWHVLLVTLIVLLIIFAATPTCIYYLRDRKPQSYEHLPSLAEMAYLVTYDSGDGMINESRHLLKVIETGVIRNSETCFHAVTVFDTYPKRKVSAPIVHSTNITLGEDEIWRSESDLRMVSEKIMETNLPIVNTAVIKVTYSGYVNYPGWPYHLNDSWTYQASYDTDVPIMSGWTDTYRVDVVADDVMVEIGDIEYPCFKVVHTLVDTGSGTPSGGGEGATIIEYWYAGSKSIGPIRIEDTVNYKGIETQIMTGELPPPSL